MAIWTLKKDYMDKVGDIFKAAAVEVAKDADKLDDLNAKHAGVWSDTTLNMGGKHEASARYADEIHAVNRHIKEIQDDAKKAALEVRNDAERDFFDFFNANVDDYDEKQVSMINSGLLTEPEMLYMAKSANRTMRRALGAKLAESKDEMTAFYGRALQQTSLNPHLEAIDSLIKAGGYAVGLGGSGPAGASYFLERWDEAVKPIYDAAPDVGCYRSTLKLGMPTRYFVGECPYTDD